MDLVQHFIPHHATKWKDIGILLGLDSNKLNLIEVDYPTDAKSCCREMLDMWLITDLTASWGKLFTVTESSAVSSSQGIDEDTSLGDSGTCNCTSYHKGCKECPTHFVPLHMYINYTIVIKSQFYTNSLQKWHSEVVFANYKCYQYCSFISYKTFL